MTGYVFAPKVVACGRGVACARRNRVACARSRIACARGIFPGRVRCRVLQCRLERREKSREKSRVETSREESREESRVEKHRVGKSRETMRNVE